MPTPVGHALGALLLTAPLRARFGWRGTAAAAAIASAAVAPDLDLLIGRHSAETHSLGAAMLAGAVVFAGLRIRAHPHAGRWAIVIACAVASHALLDWLGTDTSAPIGIMALWPFSRAFVESDLHLFMAVSRRYWLSEFWAYNVTVLARELLTLGVPALVAEWWLRRRR
ncbi:MAG: metal-dependent hydrolase [Acidobacteria bacterium]|nr:metal-dependent hydrolase [Acidobacteriota bacterium]